MKKSQKQAGFTILELLIATMVFSVILLLVTYGIIKIGNRYYKAGLESQTQMVSRNVVDEISRSIQLSGGAQTLKPATAGGEGAYCINGTMYAYKQSVIQDKNNAPNSVSHILIARPYTGDCTIPDGLFTSELKDGARDMLSDRMRIANFSITQPNSSAQSGTYKITLRVTSGQDDLLCSPSAKDCNSTSVSNALNNPDLQCKGQTGSQYCAVSELSTVITQRLRQ